MSAKSKLKFTLLAASAVALFLSPGFSFKKDGVESVYANDLTSSQNEGLGELLGNAGPSAGLAAKAPASVNDAFGQKQVAAQPATFPSAQSLNGDVLHPVAAPRSAQFPAPTDFAVQSASLGTVAGSQTPVSAAPETRRPAEVVNPFSPAPAEPAAVAEAVSATEGKVNDTALRYYAMNKDLKRLGAEMRRLKQLYPDWQPPKDLFSSGPQISEQPLWDMYKTGNFAEVRAQIARIQSANLKWQPSDDLMLKLGQGESRAMISRAYAQGNWQQVLAAAQNAPKLLVCEEMQVLWDVGEASARLGNYAQAFELYRYILSNCNDQKLRLSTVQKAALLLPEAGTTALLALGKVMPDGSTEFADIGFDDIRRQLGEFIQNGSFSTVPKDDAIARFVEFIKRKQSSEDANLIGWYFFAQNDWKNANGWFIAASRYGGAASSIDGVVLTLRKMGENDDAMKIARRYMNDAPTVAKQYVELVSEKLADSTARFEMSNADRTQFENIVTTQKLELGAQALGWKYLAEKDTKSAAKWFGDSVSWKPTEGGVVGLAVIASRANNNRELKQIKSKYGQEFAAISDFKVYTPRAYTPNRKSARTPVMTEAQKKRQRVLDEVNKSQYKG